MFLTYVTRHYTPIFFRRQFIPISSVVLTFHVRSDSLCVYIQSNSEYDLSKMPMQRWYKLTMKKYWSRLSFEKLIFCVSNPKFREYNFVCQEQFSHSISLYEDWFACIKIKSYKCMLICMHFGLLIYTVVNSYTMFFHIHQ